ncbi:MAG: T9SS type A sorting domain-containing protein [Marinoscillum sp.]
MKKLFSFLLFGLSVLTNSKAQIVTTSLPIRIDENLVVSVSSFTSDTTLDLAGQLNISGDLIFSGTLSSNGAIYLSGSDQAINIPENTHLSSFTIDGAGNKILNNALTVDSLHLINGVLSSGGLLTVGGVIEGGSSQSYVTGKLIRSGSGNLYFPLGESGLYAPISLIGVSNVTVGVQLNNQNPNGQVGHGLLGLSANRYWEVIDEGGGYTGSLVEISIVNENVAPSIEEGVVAASGAQKYRSYGASEATGDLVSGSIISADIVPPGKIAFGSYFNEALRIDDSLALVNIYSATLGSKWLKNSGWLVSSLDGWDGVALSHKRVASLGLASNNLTQTFPEISSGLESLTQLDLSGNELLGVNDLSHLTSLQTLNVSNNRLQFEDLENLLAFRSGTIYAPQKDVLERLRTIQQVGSVYTVDRTITGSANTYTWLKNGQNLDQNTSSFEVSIDDFSADGVYLAQITNENVPGLTLTTRPVVLRVSSLQRDSASLIAIYDALIAENSDVSDWKSTSISGWPEVIISNSRVTQVNLGDKGLAGDLPEDITDLEGLVSIDLSGNAIEAIPLLTDALPDLTSFDVSGNRLEFDDLEPNISLSTLSYADQQRFGSPLDEVISSGLSKVFDFNVGGAANQYQWYLSNDFVDDQPIGQATQSSYTIPSIGYQTMGEYVLKVTNSVVPGLTLESQPQKVLASADLTFVALGAGDVPIEEGVGYALKVTAPGKPYDSVQVVVAPGDNILFNDLILGDYLIAVETDGEVYLPTYYKNTDLWTQADSLGLRSDRQETLNMTYYPEDLPPLPDGGQILGTVESDFIEEDATGGRIHARRKVKRAGCSVRRFTRGGRTSQEEGEFKLIAYVQSDDEGRFEFTDLEDGLYRFNIEYPGIPMDEDSYVEFEIGGDGVEKNTLILLATITENGIVVEKIEELGFYRKYFRDLQVYPNPADRMVTISYDKLVSNNVMVRLMDMNGLVIQEARVSKGHDQSIELDVSQVEGGVYILQFVDSDRSKKSISTFKVFVKHN